MEILAVCSGNICRSPVLERVLRRLLGPDVTVHSAGTLGIFDEPAYRVCRALAPSFGIDLEDFFSKGIQEDHYRRADYVLVFAESHRHTLFSRFGARKGVHLLSEFLPRGARVVVRGVEACVEAGDSIPDPMGCPMDEVRPVLELVSCAAEGFARFLANCGETK